MSVRTHPRFGFPTDRRIMRVLRLATADLSNRLTLTQAANIAGLRAAYFSRLFRQVMGITFTEWNTRVRVDEAKQLLLFVDLSITAVAASVGYSDITTFARAFRRCESICPRHYQQMLRRPRRESGKRSTPNERQESPQVRQGTPGQHSRTQIRSLYKPVTDSGGRVAYRRSFPSPKERL